MLFNQKNYFIKNGLDFLFDYGQVLKIFYIAKYKKKKRSYAFIGLCIFKDISKFLIVNTIKRERVLFTFPMFGPSILRVFILYIYKIFSYRVNKIFFKKRFFFKDDLSVSSNKIFSSFSSFNYEFSNFFASSLWTRRRRKKLVKKYRYNEMWQKLDSNKWS